MGINSFSEISINSSHWVPLLTVRVRPPLNTVVTKTVNSQLMNSWSPYTNHIQTTLLAVIIPQHHLLIFTFLYLPSQRKSHKMALHLARFINGLALMKQTVLSIMQMYISVYRQSVYAQNGHILHHMNCNNKNQVGFICIVLGDIYDIT